MIGKTTVLVVGAGGSVPYGLPSGAKLIEAALAIPGVQALVKNQSGGDQGLTSCLYRTLGLGRQPISEFARRLAAAEVDSIDALLEKHSGDAAFQAIGKAFIAYSMHPFLSRPQLSPRVQPNEPETDWLKLVWNKMHSGARTFDAFKSGNRVSFITFNFDSIVEEKLAHAIASTYPDMAQDGARAFADALVEHVHGRLRRPTDPQLPDDLWIRDSVEEIRVVHQRSDDGLVAERAAKIAESDVVCFLGFGYHEENLRKLGIRPGSEPSTRRPVLGTRLGLGDGQKAEIVSAFPSAWKLDLGGEDEDCHAFLKSHHVLRSR